MNSRIKASLDILSGLIVFSFFFIVTYNVKYVGSEFANMTLAYCVFVMLLPCIFSILWLIFRLVRRYGPTILGRDWPEWSDHNKNYYDMTAGARSEGKARLFAFSAAIMLLSILALNLAAYLVHTSGLINLD
jgi:hypothetical protein